MVFDRDDNLYYVERSYPMVVEETQDGISVGASSDKSYDVIKKLSARGGITLVAGSSQDIGSVDGAKDQAGFDSIASLCTDSKGNLYALEPNNKTIRKIDSAGMVTTILSDTGDDALAIAVYDTRLYILRAAGIDIVRNL